jgi:hypothetical protein
LRRDGGLSENLSMSEDRRRGMPSPDEGDALALCFSEPGPQGNFNRVISLPRAATSEVKQVIATMQTPPEEGRRGSRWMV